MRIEYVGFENKELEREVDALVQLHSHIVPPWIMEARVIMCSHNEESTNTIARTYLNHDYMNMALEIYPAWIDQSRRKRAESIRHEIVHSVTNYQFNLTMDILRKFIKDKDVCDFLENQVRERLERTTCWLTNLLLLDTTEEPV